VPPGFSTRFFDRFLAAGGFGGALAGKVCGAGGGGCLVCLVDPDRKADVAATLAAGGAAVLPFKIEPEGLVVTRS
jgi:D-glycero-alpha-D-manno-heptose-7-phosphate kinase